MNFINKQCTIFNKLVRGHIIRKYNLQNVYNTEDLKKSFTNIYSYKNFIIIHNSIVNLHYKTLLDETKYSMICILYRNINYNEKTIKNSRSSINVCYLDANIKTKINNVYKTFENVNLEKHIIIIGRKYNNKLKKTNNSLELFCVYVMKTNMPNKVTDKVTDKSKLTFKNKIYDDYNKCKFLLRRKFLYNLKSEFFKNDNNTIYWNSIINNSLFLDIEYTNDIYDNFETFPISNDSSLLFLIGFTYIVQNKLEYVDLTVDKLTETNEYEILENYLNHIDSKYNSNNNLVILFHWSNADKCVIEKRIQNFPKLYERYTKMYNTVFQYVDLLHVVKKTISLKSYSLKSIAKNLLNIQYETDCKNGLDAMCSVIQNNCVLECKSDSTKLNLSSFNSTKDVIKYNKTDTELLYYVLKYFTSNV